MIAIKLGPPLDETKTRLNGTLYSNEQRKRQSIKLTLNPEGSTPIISSSASGGNGRVRTYFETRDFSSDDDLSDEDTGDLIPYRGVISGEDASTTNTLPTPSMVKHYETCVQKAAEKSHLDENATKPPVMSPKTQKALVAGGAQALLSKIKKIRIGSFEIDTWYTAPYPEEYSQQETLFLCQYCLRYMSSEYIADRHAIKCTLRHPPGREIYRSKSGKLSVYEVDGAISTQFCQNLCLLAKMFLNSKTLYYDVPAFRFYTLTENDENGMGRLVGYFSKEKIYYEENPYNVSCILCMPTAQRKGYGNFLIDFSYLLSRVEGRPGTPEKPLSELGLLAYRNYWKLAACYALRKVLTNNKSVSVSIKELSNITGMTCGDVVCALERLEFLVRDQITWEYALCIDMTVVNKVIQKWERKDYETIDESRLIWSPSYDELEDVPIAAPPKASLAPADSERQGTAIRSEDTGVHNHDSPLLIDKPKGPTIRIPRRRLNSTTTEKSIHPKTSVNGNSFSNGGNVLSTNTATGHSSPSALISTTTITTTTTTTTTTLHTSMTDYSPSKSEVEQESPLRIKRQLRGMSASPTKLKKSLRLGRSRTQID